MFAYIRRSQEDRTGCGMDHQIGVIKGYCETAPAILNASATRGKINRFFADNGVSGAKDYEKRPGLSALVRALEEKNTAGESTHLVVYDVSRVARNKEVADRLMAKLKAVCCTLHFANDRRVAEGSMGSMITHLGLIMSENEREQTIKRVKTAMKHRDWDPRRSFGYREPDGPGGKPEPIPEELAVLEEIRAMYEDAPGLRVKDIAVRVQERHGSRRCRSRAARTAPSEPVAWRGTDVAFLASKYGWKWGGAEGSAAGRECLTAAQLRAAAAQAVAQGETAAMFLKRHHKVMCDGIAVNKGMLRPYFPQELLSEYDWNVLRNVAHWIASGVKSNEQIIDELNDKGLVKKKKSGEAGWARQTVWRLTQRAQKYNEFQAEVARARAAQA